MKYARVRVGTQSVLVAIDGDAAAPLVLDNSDPWSDPLRVWLSGGSAAPATPVIAVSSAHFLSPVTAPQKVLAVGLNYRAHAEEQNIDAPTAPLLFLKSPSAIVGPGDTIQAKARLSQNVDYEGELAVVIGKYAKDVPVEDALDYVLGYTICNDVTARDAQYGDGQFFRGKSFDTFCPLGPWIVGTDEIPDPQALRIVTEVNGEVRQDAPTDEMVFSVAEVIAYASQYFPLVPGDVITTGSPAGVGRSLTPPQYLKDGDEVVVRIDGIGELRNVVSTAD